MYRSQLQYLQSEDYKQDQFVFSKYCFFNHIDCKLQNDYCLDLSSETDYFDCFDWIKLFNKLKSNNNIEELYLSNCNLYCQNAYLIAEMIKYNKKLDDLDLSNNFIRDEGAKAIIKALKVNKTLDTIWLDDNYISDEYMDFFNNYNKGK